MKKIIRGIFTFFLILFLGIIPSAFGLKKIISENIFGTYFKQEIINEYLNDYSDSKKEEVKQSLEENEQLTEIANRLGNQVLKDLLKKESSSFEVKEELESFFHETLANDFDTQKIESLYFQWIDYFQTNLSSREIEWINGYLILTSNLFLIFGSVLFFVFLGMIFILHTPVLLGVNNLSIAFLISSVLLGLIAQNLEIFCSYAVSFFRLENTISLNFLYGLSFLYLGLSVFFWFIGKRIFDQKE